MFGLRIRQLRESNVTTKQELAHYLGLSVQTITKYEKEERQPDINTLVKIADYFDVSTDCLLCRDDMPNDLIKDYVEILEENYDDISKNSIFDWLEKQKKDEKNKKLYIAALITVCKIKSRGAYNKSINLHIRAIEKMLNGFLVTLSNMKDFIPSNAYADIVDNVEYLIFRVLEQIDLIESPTSDK